MSGAPFISVVVCTRNRAASLATMLGSMAAMEVPAGLAWELIVVDNGSSDDTPAVIAGHADRLPIRGAAEPRAGLSNARNRGVAEARGSYICWTDDDVRVDRRWLAAYADAFRAEPGAVYFGGRVIPVFEGEQPDWFRDNAAILGTLAAERDLGPERRPFRRESNESPYGANFAVRAAEQKACLYNPRLGVSPDFRRLGEETAVMRKLRADGATGVWVPEAKVLHHIPRSRQTLDYVLTYQRSVGETWVALADLGEPAFMGQPFDRGGRQLGAAPLWLWRKALSAWVRYRLSRPFRPSTAWLPLLMEYGYYRGAIDYLARPTA